MEQRRGPGPHGTAGQRNANGHALVPWPRGHVSGATAGGPLRGSDKASRMLPKAESLLADVSEAP